MVLHQCIWNLQTFQFMYSYNSETGSVFVTEGMVKIEPKTLAREMYVEWLSAGNSPEETDYKSPEEIFEHSKDIEYVKYLSRIKDGIEAIANFSAKMRALKLAGIIVEDSHRVIDNALEPIRNKLIAGQWIDAREYLVGLGYSVIGEQLYNDVLAELEKYITKNY